MHYQKFQLLTTHLSWWWRGYRELNIGDMLRGVTSLRHHIPHTMASVAYEWNASAHILLGESKHALTNYVVVSIQLDFLSLYESYLHKDHKFKLSLLEWWWRSYPYSCWPCHWVWDRIYILSSLLQMLHSLKRSQQHAWGPTKRLKQNISFWNLGRKPSQKNRIPVPKRVIDTKTRYGQTWDDPYR